MTKILRLVLSVWLISLISFQTAWADDKNPLIGEVEGIYTLANDTTEIRGLAFDEYSSKAPRLFVLDRVGKIFVYKLNQNSSGRNDILKLEQTYDLPLQADKSPITNPRGLAFTVENDQGVLYFLNWDNSKSEVVSQLWRCNFDNNKFDVANLSLYPFKIGNRQILDLAFDKGKIFICFDATGYTDQILRVERGMIQVRWNPTHQGQLEFVKHMPDSGRSLSHGLTSMEFEGAHYLWATIDRDYIYAADGRTGRGLFHFNHPAATGKNNPAWGLAYGNGSLWVAENITGPDRIYRVNVTKNPDEYYEGPRILRHLSMTIKATPENNSPNPGKVYHNYSRPYGYDQLHNQGIWPETEKITDLSAVSNAAIRTFTHDPAGDISSRQYMGLVAYANAPARTYSSKYEIDIWTNPYRKYVYPHRVNKNSNTLNGTNYLADDVDLYNLSDTDTYDSFFQRVKEHIELKYQVPTDMDNPYWAARNALEYIQDHYYYPYRPMNMPAAVDYDQKHYDANPGNLKIDLSRSSYDKSQLIACSGTSVMLAGAMRYIGFPARWLGTGTEKGPADWDNNHNGLLDENEIAPCSNGHRYTQVWLGSNYGWICFDATPTKPPFNDYDPTPPIQSQWRYMNRAAAGHLKDKRLVFNIGSEMFEPLYRDFEYDEQLAIDNNCGGDQRYNLQGRFEIPQLWKLPRHRINVENICFIENVDITGPKNATKVAWSLKGDWNKDPQATVSICLQQLNQSTRQPKEVEKLAQGLHYDSKSVLVNLAKYSGKGFRIIIRKDGDPETGGHSQTFELK
ncbi:MAG: transglutaminase domain-containing protein [Planctomycetes bacterium]|nr:transglutaminase domain-containing protein [Planctomycetota bacterium]